MVAAKGWPSGADLTPVLDIAFAIPPTPEGKQDWVLTGLSDAFLAKDADTTSILERVIEARLAGYPGPWRRLGGALDGLLARAPGDAIASAAERAIASEDDDTALWALGRLLQKPFAHARRLLAEPRYRALIFDTEELCELCFPILREQLRAGVLDRAQAETVIAIIGSLYGGVADNESGTRGIPGQSTRIEEQRRKKIEALGELLGPPELAGPPTDEEWRTLRELQAQWVRGGLLPRPPRGQPLGVFCEGPWSPEDWAVVDAAVRVVREDPTSRAGYLLAISIAEVLAAKPDPDGLEIIGEFLKTSHRERQGYMKLLRRDLRVGLGLPEIPPKAAAVQGGEAFATATDASREWMDEPDD